MEEHNWRAAREAAFLPGYKAMTTAAMAWAEGSSEGAAVWRLAAELMPDLDRALGSALNANHAPGWGNDLARAYDDIAAFADERGAEALARAARAAAQAARAQHETERGWR